MELWYYGKQKNYSPHQSFFTKGSRGMNTKNILYALITIASTTNLYTLENIELPRQLSEKQQQRLIDKSKPRDTTKTPTSPDIIEHDGNELKGGRKFHRKRIYFGTLDSGEHHYATIYEHSQNPNFNNIRLVILKKASFFSSLLSYVPFLNISADDYFEVIGTYGDKIARSQLIYNIAKNGGLWCPNQENPIESFFIGGTREKCMCDLFKEFEQQPAPESTKFKK